MAASHDANAANLVLLGLHDRCLDCHRAREETEGFTRVPHGCRRGINERLDRCPWNNCILLDLCDVSRYQSDPMGVDAVDARIDEDIRDCPSLILWDVSSLEYGVA